MPDWGKFQEYGLIGLIVAALFFIVWRLLVWVMAFVKDIMAQQVEERVAWRTMIDTMRTSIDLHNQASIESRNSVQEAHKFQRCEHENMMNNLIEINKLLFKMNGSS